MLLGLFRDVPWVGLPTDADVVGLFPSSSVSTVNFSSHLASASVSIDSDRLGRRPNRFGLGVAGLLFALRLKSTEVLLPTPDGEFDADETLSRTLGLLGLRGLFGLLAPFGLFGGQGLFGHFNGELAESAGSLAVRVGAASSAAWGSDNDLSILARPLPRPRGDFPGDGLPGEPLIGVDLLRPTIGAGLEGVSLGGGMDSSCDCEVATLPSSPVTHEKRNFKA